MQATFTKVGNRGWGVRVIGPAQPGDKVEVRKKSGEEKPVVLGELLEQRAVGAETAGVYEICKYGSTVVDAKDKVTEPGVYERGGVVYVVKPNRARTGLYAKRLVEIEADRLNDNDDRVQIEFEYDRGAIFGIKATDKMDLERAKELTIRYGRCIVCGRGLKAAESVERGIGPVCIKSFG